jgi:hypothetical protein
MMKLSIQCTSFEVIIIVVVQIEAVKIYVAAVEALKENERGGQNSEHDETQFSRKKGCISYPRMCPI